MEHKTGRLVMEPAGRAHAGAAPEGEDVSWKPQFPRQTTIRKPICVRGRGVHSATDSAVELLPARPDTGIVFAIRKNGKLIEIPACHRTVSDSFLSTTVSNREGVSISTVEHLLAAVYGLGIDNLLVAVDGVEVPIMDGSAGAFVDAIDSVGIRQLDRPRRFIKVLKPVSVREQDRWCELRPHTGFKLDVEIAFAAPVIGRQRRSLEICPKVFRSELSRARTFGFMEDVATLRPAGRALGSNLANTIVIQDGKILNRGGLRYPNEFVRHKMLDAVGDLALAGARLLCSYHAHRAGHAMNAVVLQKLFADETAWESVCATSGTAKAISEPRLPPVGLAGQA